MSGQNAQHGSFTIRRVLEAPVAMVFNAFADSRAKQLWFTAPTELSDVVREQDFRVGGRERFKGRWASGLTSDFRAEYWDIVTDRRIVYVYEMYLDGVKISVSLATLEFETLEFETGGAGTRLTVTEQGAFLDGYDDAGSRERGTAGLIDKLEQSLRPPN